MRGLAGIKENKGTEQSARLSIEQSAPPTHLVVLPDQMVG